MKKIIFIVLISVLFVGTLVWIVARDMGETTQYEVGKLSKNDLKKRTMATGNIVPRKEVAIKPQSISGIIEKLFVEEGDIIKKGSPVAKIAIIPSEQNLNAAISRVKIAKINFENADVNYRRDKKLFDAGVIADAEFEQSQLKYRNAQEELNTAKTNLQITKTGTVSGNKASNTTIRSTISGMILKVPVKIGNSVIASNSFNDGTTIALVADMDEIIFEGKVDETDVAKLFIGMPIELTIGAINNEKFDAELEHIAPKGEKEGGAVKFNIKAKVLLKKGQTLRAGYSANANIILDKRENVYTLQENSLIFRGDSTFVEILVSDKDAKEQKFEERYITTGLSDGINVEIKSGVKPDEYVKLGIKTENKAESNDED